MEDMIPQGSPAPHEGPGYDTSDVGIRGILIFAIALILTTAVTMTVLAGWYAAMSAREQEYRQERPPRFAEEDPSQFPPPVIQAVPLADMVALRAEEDALLNSYGWVDEESGIARIPIARAMDLTLERLREEGTTPAGASPEATPAVDEAPDADPGAATDVDEAPDADPGAATEEAPAPAGDDSEASADDTAG